MSKPESHAETQYRLASEAECRRIAELVKKELSPRLGFVLITADIGDNKRGFSNTSYVATVNREDSQRLLTELLDHWREGGLSCEPTVATATKLRELVFDARRFSPVDLVKAVHLGVKELDEAMAAEDLPRAVTAAFVVSGTALALLDSYHQFRAAEERKARGE